MSHMLKKSCSRVSRGNRITLGSVGQRGRRRMKQETSEGARVRLFVVPFCAFVRLRSFELFGRVAELCFIAAVPRAVPRKRTAGREGGVRLG